MAQLHPETLGPRRRSPVWLVGVAGFLLLVATALAQKVATDGGRFHAVRVRVLRAVQAGHDEEALMLVRSLDRSDARALQAGRPFRMAADRYRAAQTVLWKAEVRAGMCDAAADRFDRMARLLPLSDTVERPHDLTPAELARCAR
jgi:hypothetical protein